MILPSSISCYRLRVALALVLSNPLVLGCKEPKPERLRFGPAELIAQLDVQPSAATRGADGSFVVGTRDGELLLLAPDGKRSWIARRSGASQPAGNVAPQGKGTGGSGSDSAPVTYDGPITALALAADGRHLLAAGGQRIVWWQLRPRVEPLAQLVGPQPITTAVLTPGDRSALFGTSQGHLLEWTLDEREARALPKVSCGATRANPKRAKLAPPRRCPYGTYLELPTGRAVCIYPLTHLIRRGDLFARACRTGEVALFRHGKPPHRHELAGALGALTFVGKDRLLFARRDGELRLYDSQNKKILKSFDQSGRPQLADESEALIAVAEAKRIRLWRANGGPAGALKLPTRATWLELRGKTLELLLGDGRLLRWSIEPASAGREAS